MTPHRTQLASFVVTLLVASITVAGCASASATVTSNNQVVTVVQHQAQMTVASGQTSTGTASCDPGEVLVSGGYYSSQQLKYGDVAVLDSYPSDASGTAPSAQGQVETAWTVQAQNPSSASVNYTIMVQCVKGIPIKMGVWFTAFSQTDPNGNDARVSQQCPNEQQGVLTGGGFQATLNGGKVSTTDGVVMAYPSQQNGVAHQWWNLFVWDVNGTSYIVCAKNVTAAPEVSTGDYDFSKAVKYLSVSCAENDVLVGGGHHQGDLKGGADTVTVNTAGVPGLGYWDAGYNTVGDRGWLEVDGICIEAQLDQRIFITFSNYHHLIRIPADKVIVATDGSGQVKASQVTVRVTQHHSAPIAATKTSNPFTGGVSYAVPAGCGDPGPAQDAATPALKQMLNGMLPAGQVAFGAPVVTLDRGSLTCSPVAGTSRTAPFTFVQAIDGNAVQSSFTPQDVTNYQLSQLKQDTTALGTHYVLRDTLICPDGPQLLSATSTRATVQCTAYGVAEWQWTQDALQVLAQSLAGKSEEAALQILNSTPGIETNTAVIDLPSGNTLPSDASKVVLILVRLQDTAPVVRGP